MTPKTRRKPNPWGRVYRVTRGGKVVAVRPGEKLEPNTDYVSTSYSVVGFPSKAVQEIIKVAAAFEKLHKRAHRSRARKGHAKSLDYWQGMINC